MISDSFFCQGTSHNICEDYAVAKDNYGIVCDGCSSANDTDFGARILSKISQKYIAEENFADCVKSAAEIAVACIPNIGKDCLSATILTIVALDDMFLIRIIGDGYWGLRNRETQQWKYGCIEFVKGAPFYLQYEMSNSKLKWHNEFKETDSNSLIYEKRDCQEGFNLWNCEKIAFDIANPIIEFAESNKTFDIGFVASDGIGSFYRNIKTQSGKSNEKISDLNVLKRITDFVTLREEFVKLQCNWLFKKQTKGTFKYDEWQNSDDLSIAAVHVQ